jgi:hypothetical protein
MLFVQALITTCETLDGLIIDKEFNYPDIITKKIYLTKIINQTKDQVFEHCSNHQEFIFSNECGSYKFISSDDTEKQLTGQNKKSNLHRSIQTI